MIVAFRIFGIPTLHEFVVLVAIRVSMSTVSSHSDKDLDLSNANRAVWLVKVPKYVANKWDKAPGNIEVGKLKITKALGQKTHVSLTLSESVLCLKQPGEENIPREHRLDVSTVTRQTLGVFSHVTPSNSDSVVPETEKLSLEGRVVQKLECRPYADNCYMKMKLESIRKAALPTRQVQQLERIVHNFKPVSDHKHNIEYEEKKKSEGKKARDDKDAVLEMLFAAFEKHQYYNIKDLVKITRQPIVYLKDILKEVCNYNMKNPHKNMWELKPEYRHYKDPPPATSASKTD
ncbi:general transcription factor IIF subunit 2 isoform X1 [Schistocerca cancellata]|uniref:general transcription factor IIF subunit 2 isoform X1 n=2 Tax=Schistocerca TaxID=7008 RepID=UPI0021193952|nr:general transcription factor IIF subunit 2 isoform X1 [Schistocerca cancellata]